MGRGERDPQYTETGPNGSKVETVESEEDLTAVGLDDILGYMATHEGRITGRKVA